MRKGVAGFFTQEELDAGKGIVHTKLDLMEVAGKQTGGYKTLAPLGGIESYDDSEISAIRSPSASAAARAMVCSSGGIGGT